MCKIALSEGHEETDSLYSRNILCKRLDLLMMEKVHILFSYLGEIVFSLYGHGGNLYPVTVLPVASRRAYLTEIHLRVKVCSEGISMITTITVKDIYGMDLVKIVF